MYIKYSLHIFSYYNFAVVLTLIQEKWENNVKFDSFKRIERASRHSDRQ